MAEIIIMPRQGQSVESCVITGFNKKTGDTVNTGDVLFTYETDKSAFEETAQTSGTVIAIVCNEGDDVPCLEPVMIIGESGEDISGLLPSAAKKAIPDATENHPVNAIAPSPQEGTVRIPVRMAISPRAKEYAEKANVDISRVTPTGPSGRIIERDIIEAVAAGDTHTPTADIVRITPATGHATAVQTEYTEEKHSNIRKVIAGAMHNSLATMAQLTLNSSFDAASIINFRKKIKDNGEKLQLGNITLNDIVLYATAKTLLKHKSVNAHYYDDFMRYFNTVNLGVAVDTERGLMVPTIFGADKLSLNELSRQTKDIITESQKGTISPDKLKDGTFTVTNLGSLGVESFTPVINPPQTCILGVNNITKRHNNDGELYDAMGLSLTFDHRALDGAPAARFLKDLCSNLENFELLLAI